MKTWIALLSLLFAPGLLFAADSGPKGHVSSATVAALTREIKANLPPGWTVTFNMESSEIEVERTEKTLANWVGPSSPIEESKLLAYQLKLRVTPLISTQEYNRLSMENEERAGRIKKLREVLLNTPGIREIRPGLFYPLTEPGKRAVLEYKRLVPTLHELPDYYYRDISLFWERFAEFQANDQTVQAECDQVPVQLRQLLDPYLEQAIAQKTVRLLMVKLRAQIPEGWSVSYDDEFHLISVIRNAPTSISTITPSSGIDAKPEVGRFSFSLRVLPLMSQADYGQKKADNQAIKKRMSAIYEMLAKSPSVVGIRAGGPKPLARFHSEVPEEQARIEQYYRLQDELYDLPDGYFKDISLSWTEALRFGMGPLPDDPAVRSETEAVLKKMVQVPSNY